jgi:hypothetical protein
MSKARNIADLLSSTGAVKATRLSNVPPSNNASALTLGTLPDGRFPSTLPAISGANLIGVATEAMTEEVEALALAGL